MIKPQLKFALTLACVVTSYVTFTLVAINAGFKHHFLFVWLRSWLVAFLLVVPSMVFVAPLIRRIYKL